MITLILISGCNSIIPAKKGHIPYGYIVEVAESTSAICYIRNKRTGKLEKREVPVLQGYKIVRPRLEDFGK